LVGGFKSIRTKKLELDVLSDYPQLQPSQANPLWKPNPLWNGKAIAWVATSGSDANSTTATTIAIALRVIVVFEFIVSISKLSTISTMSYIRRMYYKYANTYYIYIDIFVPDNNFVFKNITGKISKTHLVISFISVGNLRTSVMYWLLEA